MAYAEVLPTGRTPMSLGFLGRAIRFFAQHGVHVTRLMTDSGPAYRSIADAAMCRRLRTRHVFTQPYRPQTNGKAQGSSRPWLREWAYACAYPTSNARTRALPGFLTTYDHTRPHKALAGEPRGERLTDRNNPAAANT